METSVEIVRGLIDLLKTGGLYGMIAFSLWLLAQIIKIFIIAIFSYFGIKVISNTLLKVFGK